MLYSALEIPVGSLEGCDVFSPDDVADGARIEGPVVVYDFDNYYMGSALAEHLARLGQAVSYVTPAGHASAWAIMSNEQPQIHRALFAAGVALHTLSRVTGFEGGELALANQFTGAATRLACKSLVIVGARLANEDRKSTRLNSSHSQISYAVFCLKKKKKNNNSLTLTYKKKSNTDISLTIQLFTT